MLNDTNKGCMVVVVMATVLFCIVYVISLFDSPKPPHIETPLEQRQHTEFHFYQNRNGEGDYSSGYIQSHANDPSSYEHISTMHTPNEEGLRVTVYYRERNAYGALVRRLETLQMDSKGERVLYVIEKSDPPETK